MKEIHRILFVRNDRIGDVVGLIRENMKPARFVRLAGGHFGGYVHHDGSVGVMLQVEGEKVSDEQVLRDVCMHITARNPVAVTLSFRFDHLQELTGKAADQVIAARKAA